MTKRTTKKKSKSMTYREQLANAIHAKVKKYHGKRVTTPLLSYILADAIRAVKEVDEEAENQQAVKDALALVKQAKRRKIAQKTKPLSWWDVYREASKF